MRNINSEYQVGKMISCGTFGQVFEGIHILKKTKVVIKREIGNRKTLKQEKKMLKTLQGIIGVPQLYFYGVLDGANIIILENLESDLAVLKRAHGKFTLKTVLQIALQSIGILSQIHARKIIHRDLKPENIMVGGQQKGQIYIIDYGISKFYMNKGQLIPFRKDKYFVGTIKYASLASHLGYEQSPKDDIESLLYVLVELFNGQLPWEEYQNVEATGKLKQQITDSQLFKGLPQQFNQIYLQCDINIFRYIRKLPYHQNPNYEYITKVFLSIATDLNINIDQFYEWNKYDAQLLNTFNILKQQFSPTNPWINDSQVNYESEEEEEETIQQKLSKINILLEFENPLI
ncbi:unnamed protein product [Paramecium sonneborni]|uniref:Casein kinase I n=1 Tax=Paramecium sonneborni TaxID=65129 RepID=A0A8S1JV97_9CILI|nr:unnamed protein product [Paramecium sonneborni]